MGMFTISTALSSSLSFCYTCHVQVPCHSVCVSWHSARASTGPAAGCCTHNRGGECTAELQGSEGCVNENNSTVSGGVATESEWREKLPAISSPSSFPPSLPPGKEA